MGNVETTTKFSRLKSVSSIEDNCFFYSDLFIFKGLFYNYKGKL